MIRCRRFSSAAAWEREAFLARCAYSELHICLVARQSACDLGVSTGGHLPRAIRFLAHKSLQNITIRHTVLLGIRFAFATFRPMVPNLSLGTGPTGAETG